MKARYLFGLGLILAAVGIWAMRGNAVEAMRLRDLVLQKDQAGADVTADIETLRGFVFSHMNSSVRFELNGAYQRAVAAQSQAQTNSQIYAQAQAACGPEVGTNSVAQVACVQRYLDSHSAPATSASPPPSAEYTYAFASPAWTPDIAGWSILGAIAALIAAVILYVRAQFKSRIGTAA